jgi:uncharacterized protein YjbI with pentapeptide repeats
LRDSEEANTKKKYQAIVNWIKENPLDALLLFFLLVITLVILFQRFVLGWITWQTWTGFGETIVENETTNPAKTLWDWMGLLVIPLGVAYIASRFTKTMKQNELKIAEQRSKREQEISLDQQRENALQSYFDRITELLLREGDGLKTSNPEDEIRVIARARAVSAINMLDPKRKGLLTQFLHEAQLLHRRKRIVSLEGANLIGIFLEGASLCEVDFSGLDLGYAKLRYVNLSKSNLSNSNLSGSDLRNADMRMTNLFGTNLSTADLREAELVDYIFSNEKGWSIQVRSGSYYSRFRHTNLKGVDLRETDLREINLRSVNLTDANLSQCSFVGAILNGTNLENADLSRADLRGVDLSKANLKRANLREANLMWVHLMEPSWQWDHSVEAGVLGYDDTNRAKLLRTNLSGSDLSEADLSGAKLKWALLNKSNLNGSNFFKANLSEADLRGVDLRNTNFCQAILRKAKLENTILPDKQSLIEIMFKEAIMPDGNIYNPEIHQNINKF